jgi:hypothetical protein
MEQTLASEVKFYSTTKKTASKGQRHGKLFTTACGFCHRCVDDGLYRITERGQRLMTAALRIRQTDIGKLAA